MPDKKPDKKKAAATGQPLTAKKYPQNNPARPDTNPYVAIIAGDSTVCLWRSANMRRRKTPGITPRLFGLVHGAVGSINKAVDGTAMVRTQGNTNRNADAGIGVMYMKGLGQRLHNVRGYPGGVIGFMHRVEYQNKLIAAQPGEQIIGAYTGLQTAGNDF